jgi:hypothetical protein
MERQDQLIRDAYIQFLRSREFDAYFRKLHRPPRWRYILAVPMIVSLAGVGVGLGLIASAWLSNRKRKRIRRELIAAAEHSVPVMAYPLMANRALMRRNGTVAPALTIGTFETDARNEEMVTLAKRMLMVAHQDVSRESALTVIKMFEDEEYAEGRRRVVPNDLTGGRRVYAFDLMMIGDYLPTDTLELPMVPCLAEPGETGTIQMIPWWIVARAWEAESKASPR